jgi:uncharacterized protein (TIGR03437 family)
MLRTHLTKLLLPLAGLAVWAGTASATTTLVAPSTVTLNCDTVLGPTPATVAIALSATGSSATSVTAAVVSPVVIQGTNPQNVGPSTTAVNYTFSLPAGCSGLTVGSTSGPNITFTGGGMTATVKTTLVVTASSSALVVSPSAVTLTCNPGSTATVVNGSQVVTVRSAAPGGTPFTVVGTGAPSWLAASSFPSGTKQANDAGFTFTITLATGACNNLPVGSSTFNVQLTDLPAAPVTLPVTLQVAAVQTLTPSPTSLSLSYTTGTALPGSCTSPTCLPITFTSSPNVFFTVNQATVPSWLNVTPTSNTATNSGVTANFAVTAAAKTLNPGIYNANVHFTVSGDLDTVVPVSLEVQNPAATLSAAEGTTRNLSWVLGAPLPTLFVTAVSSDAPIAFTAAASGALAPQLNITSGLAYSFGTPIAVTFQQSVFGAAAPGSTLTGTVTLTNTATSAQVVVTINVAVLSPAALISSIYPAALPTATSGQFTVTLTGSGFVSSGGASMVTNVGVVTGSAPGTILADPNVSASVVNSTTIVLTITVPSSSDPYLPFSGNGGPVTLGVCNPQGSTCTTPTGSMVLTIGTNPIIQAVTSAASYNEATPPALVPVAPYDLVSIFGTNFCISNGTGCTGTSAILYGSPSQGTNGNPGSDQYPTSVTPDTGASPRNVSVTFQTHGGSPSPIAMAPILFASNGQINVVVPSEVAQYNGITVDIVVSFGSNKSQPYSVVIAPTDPGAFTIGGDGQGAAAALSAAYSVISQSSPAFVRSNNPSDTIQLYVAGLGQPDANAMTYSGTSCMTPAAYLTALNGAAGTSLTSLDGLVMQGSLLGTDLAPCLTTAPTVTLGGVPVTTTIQYAGWVANSVAGLYQVNILLPAADYTTQYTNMAGTAGVITSTPVELPIRITAGGQSSQAGVGLWVAQTLKVTFSGATSGTVGTAWAGSTITTTDGTAPYTYTVLSGTLPAGLSLDVTTPVSAPDTIGSGGSETPSAATTGSGSTVTFQVTDSNGLTGTVTVTFTVAP